MDTDSNKSKFQTSIVPKYIITMLEFGICLKKGYYFDPPVTKIQSSVRRNISILIDEGPVLVYQRTKAKLCTVGGGSFLFPPVQCTQTTGPWFRGSQHHAATHGHDLQLQGP